MAVCPGKEEMNFVEHNFSAMHRGTYFLLYNQWLLLELKNNGCILSLHGNNHKNDMKNALDVFFCFKF